MSSGVVLVGNQPIAEINELDGYYVCIVDNVIIGDPMKFLGGISKSTSYSGYPFKDSTKSAVYCKNGEVKGKWISIKDAATLFEVDEYDLFPVKEVIVEPKPNLENTVDYGYGTRTNKEDCKTDGKCYPI